MTFTSSAHHNRKKRGSQRSVGCKEMGNVVPLMRGDTVNTYVTGAAVKLLREAKGMTQSELGNMIGVGSKAVSKWETGKGLPDITLLEPLAKALDVSVMELIHGEPVVNSNVSGNLLRSKIHVCPVCGNVLHAVGDAVISGCISVDGLLKVRTTREFGESTVAKILELVENSASNKSKSEAFITRFAKYYTPAVVISAVILAVFIPLIFGNFSMWLERALIFLVVSCPCALVISVPLSFFAGIGKASKNGILIKGSNYLEALSNAKTVVFDKTGTLTYGDFFVDGVYPQNISKDELIELAAKCEFFSNHPISVSLKKEYR